MNRHARLTVAAVAAAVLVAGGCREARQPAPKPQLLVYCGITMVRPMAEIAEMLQRREPCEVIITKGGSGNLLKSIRVNQVGDLYLPGSDSYMNTCLDEGLVEQTVEVGANRAAILVRKGNPLGLKPDMRELTRDDLYVVVGNPASGSIGQETARILDVLGLRDAVLANARRLTTDSKDLIAVLAEKEADIVVNWYATSTWPENRPHVDALRLGPDLATPKRLVLGLLTASAQPELGRKFMELAASDQGRAVFEKYGLGME